MCSVQASRNNTPNEIKSNELYISTTNDHRNDMHSAHASIRTVPPRNRMQDYTNVQEISFLLKKAHMQDSPHACIHLNCCSSIPNLGYVVCTTAREFHHVMITPHTWHDFIQWRKGINPYTNVTSDSLTGVYLSFIHWYTTRRLKRLPPLP